MTACAHLLMMFSVIEQLTKFQILIRVYFCFFSSNKPFFQRRVTSFYAIE